MTLTASSPGALRHYSVGNHTYCLGIDLNGHNW
jgi:hypothetical protein